MFTGLAAPSLTHQQAAGRSPKPTLGKNRPGLIHPTQRIERNGTEEKVKLMIEYVTYRHAYGRGHVNVQPDAHGYAIPQHWLVPTRRAFEIASV